MKQKFGAVLTIMTVAGIWACQTGDVPEVAVEPESLTGQPVGLPATWTPTKTVPITPSLTPSLTPSETPIDPTSLAATATRAYRDRLLPQFEEASLTLQDMPSSYIEMPVDEYDTWRSLYALQTGLDLATINAFTEERDGTIVMSMTFTYYRIEDLETFDEEALDIEGQIQTMLESLGGDPTTRVEVWSTFPAVGDVHVAVRMTMEFLGQTVFYEAVSFRREHVIASIYILRTASAQAPYLPTLAAILDERIQAVFEAQDT